MTDGLLPDASASRAKRFSPDIDFAPFIAFQDERAWAVQKAMFFPNIALFYSLIPKNACTSLLTAFAMANGLTTKWFQTDNRIHNLQVRYQAFTDLDRFSDDSFKVVALRDPFKRAISAVTNKLLGHAPEYDIQQRFFTQRLNKPIGECRLSEIFRLCDTVPHWLVEQHFAPQWSFLMYDRYDLVLDADQPIDGFDIGGGRHIALTQHNSHAKPRSDDDIGDATIDDIRAFLKDHGCMPCVAGQQRVFASSVRRGGNYDRDFQLYAALK